MREHKNFWDRNAGLYDCFMRKDRAVYEKMYELIRPVVKDKTVLEVATGTGLIAKHIVKAAAHIEATDASPEMIAKAKQGNYSAKLLLCNRRFAFSRYRTPDVEGVSGFAKLKFCRV